MEKQISVIIPVYNTKKYLERCFESLRSQTYSSFQAILVDDGSLDGSGALCDLYAQMDKRFQVIHKENAGPSRARNCALDVAMGDYVFFLDSDDYLSEDAFQIMVDHIDAADMVCCAYTRVDEDERICSKQFSVPSGVLNRKEMLHLLLYEDRYGFVGYLFPKLYKRQIIQTNHLRFEESLKHNEDRVFVAAYVLHSRDVCFGTEGTYFYRQREDSLVHSVGASKFSRDCLHELFGFEKMKDLFASEYKEEWYRTSRLIFEKSLFWHKIIPSNMRQEKKENERLLNENFWICLQDKNQKALKKIKTIVHWLIKR